MPSDGDEICHRRHPARSARWRGQRHRPSTASPVPALLEPGPAQFHSTLVSQCPEGTVHDLMAAFTFTVTPR